VAGIENRKRQAGFVLVLVIIAIAVIGIEMFALAGVANTMQFQSHTAYLQACRRNLTASGLAWARQNIPNKTGESVPEAIKLDTGEMNIRGSALDLTISRPSDKEAEVLIRSSCSRGRQTLKGEYRYKLSP
jgi:D-alanyl-D-alanine dipeptidase